MAGCFFRSSIFSSLLQSGIVVAREAARYGVHTPASYLGHELRFLVYSYDAIILIMLEASFRGFWPDVALFMLLNDRSSIVPNGPQPHWSSSCPDARAEGQNDAYKNKTYN